MAEYELVYEIKNLCRNNQMRDVFFEDVECDDPEALSLIHILLEMLIAQTEENRQLKIRLERAEPQQPQAYRRCCEERVYTAVCIFLCQAPPPAVPESGAREISTISTS